MRGYNLKALKHYLKRSLLLGLLVTLGSSCRGTFPNVQTCIPAYNTEASPIGMTFEGEPIYEVVLACDDGVILRLPKDKNYACYSPEDVEAAQTWAENHCK